jgi:hypothetical protein
LSRMFGTRYLQKAQACFSKNVGSSRIFVTFPQQRVRKPALIMISMVLDKNKKGEQFGQKEKRILCRSIMSQCDPNSCIGLVTPNGL